MVFNFILCRQIRDLTRAEDSFVPIVPDIFVPRVKQVLTIGSNDLKRSCRFKNPTSLGMPSSYTFMG